MLLGGDDRKLCIVEPYMGGSHASLIHLLQSRYPNHSLYSMRAKKWHWRMRTAALTFSQQIPVDAGYDVLLVSSMINLADLLALRPDLREIDNITLYCHENQLEYPKQEAAADDETAAGAERDHYFGHANIMSCLVAKQILFNSSFNLESFLGKIPAFLNRVPMEQQCRPQAQRICDEIRAKSRVVYMLVESVPPRLPPPTSTGLVIGFPHRWEHDKDPEMFLRVLQRLASKRCRFRVRVYGGEEYEHVNIRSDFERALGGDAVLLEHCGRLESRQAYLASLAQCDVVVSTARHEFFGVSMVEAALLGCQVLCPNRLAYPELFHASALYNTEAQLAKALQQLCFTDSNNSTRSRPPQLLLPGVESRVDVNAQGGEAFDEAILRCFAAATQHHHSSKAAKLVDDTE